ncbi:MAG TPA: hypothetical protein VM287_05960 [Egibacteraceae bacterium]|nr:hypothetical protein [Egibacteraceae bacterium]
MLFAGAGVLERSRPRSGAPGWSPDRSGNGDVFDYETKAAL